MISIPGGHNIKDDNRASPLKQFFDAHWRLCKWQQGIDSAGRSRITIRNIRIMFDIYLHRLNNAG